MTNAPLVKSIRLSTVLGGDVRLEASTYLRDGYGFVSLANQCDNHKRLGDLADIWQPNRLTGYNLAAEQTDGVHRAGRQGVALLYRRPGVRGLPPREKVARSALCAAS